MTEPDLPQFAHPLRVVGGAHVLVDQDSDAEVLDCVQRCLETPLGFPVDEPGFGLREQAMRRGGADLDEIAAALDDWEPRVTALIDRDPRLLVEQLVDRVAADVDPIEQGAS